MAISKKAKTRILRLCDYMESLPRESARHFSMVTFFNHSGKGHAHKISATPKLADLHTCGTTACALGYAITNPHFRRAGLFMDSSLRVQGAQTVFDLHSIAPGAWSELFDSYTNDRTPKQWAKRARKLVREWEKSPA